ncbi:MAG: rhodanese-like domain-containing protein [Elusimicrobia bacterium]|nr:rhodanese-like domain-containing protein [Elusimicrobiota bacterium]MBD3412429.1 rhodanese-like domain-containing protein [Elusimicrobiota bacterium]
MAKQISRQEMIILFCTGKKVKLIDVLSREHYNQEHISGSLSLPLDTLEHTAPEILDKNDLIITYCANNQCIASSKAAEKLEKMGYKNVYDYKAGLQDYRNANLPLDGSLHPKTEPKENIPCPDYLKHN